MWEFNGNSRLEPDGLGHTIEAFLGRHVHFKGVIRFEGAVQLDGRLDGEIHTNGTLVVGEHAVITGIVSAGTVVSGGRIKGSVTATQKVQLLKSAVVLGEIHTPAIQIEEGAHFQGVSDMGATAWDEVEARTEQPDNLHDLAARRSKVRSLSETEPTN